MPELPEVSGLVGFLDERIVGRAIVGVELGKTANDSGPVPVTPFDAPTEPIPAQDVHPAGA